jgi:hypothetical protein
MQEQDIRRALLACFKACRATPDAPFDEDDFLNFLTTDSKAFDDSVNDVELLQRLSAFYGRVQEACAVCIPPADTMRRWPLEALEFRIIQLRNSPAEQAAAVQERLAAAERRRLTEPLKFGGLMVLPGALIVWSFIGGWTAGAVLLPLAALIVFLIYRQQLPDVRYYTRLRDSILAIKPRDA